MAETYLLRGARQLLTLRGAPEVRRGSQLNELSIISDGALLIRDGRIEEVGMTRRVENLAAAKKATVIDATGRVVMPAFVDPLVTLVFAHHGTEGNDARLKSGVSQTPASHRDDILDAVRALKLLSKKRLTMRALTLASSMTRHGTGTAGAASGYGIDSTGEVKSLRAAEAVDGKPLDVVSIFLGGGVVPLTGEIARRKLARFAAVRCGPLAFGVEAARAYLVAAREHGLERAVYSQQFASDDSVRLAVELDAVSATHLEHIDDESAEMLAGSRTIGVLTPAATFHMGLTRFAPARRLIDQGGAVALASSFNPDQCPTYSMPFVIAMACRYLGMSAEEAISAATINAAHALRRAERVGSFETGKQADVLILNARDYRELPLTPGVNLVHTMIKSGRVAYQEGKC